MYIYIYTCMLRLIRMSIQDVRAAVHLSRCEVSSRSAVDGGLVVLTHCYTPQKLTCGWGCRHICDVFLIYRGCFFFNMVQAFLGTTPWLEDTANHYGNGSTPKPHGCCVYRKSKTKMLILNHAIYAYIYICMSSYIIKS